MHAHDAGGQIPVPAVLQRFALNFRRWSFLQRRACAERPRFFPSATDITSIRRQPNSSERSQALSCLRIEPSVDTYLDYHLIGRLLR